MTVATDDIEGLTPELIVERFPWELSEGERPVEWDWSFDIEAPRWDVWKAVSDTTLFNRAFGHPKMTYREVDGALHGSCRYSGVLHEWVEPPWDWVAGRHAAAIRHFSRGMATTLRIRFVFEELAPGRTRLWIRMAFTPRNAAFRAMYHAAETSWRKRYAGAVRRLEFDLKAGVELPLRNSPNPDEFDVHRLAAVADRVRELADSDAGDVLEAWIRQADDADLERVRLRPLARATKVDERELIVAALHATRVGMLQLTWDVICPHCRGVRESVATLGEVPSRSRCEPCAAEFENDTTQSIEVTFRVHPSVRMVEEQVYCAAETAARRHVLVQWGLRSGESVALHPELGFGAYRVRLRRSERSGTLTVGPDGRSISEVQLSNLHDHTITPRPALRFTNDTGSPQVVLLEDVSWRDDALHPGDLFGLQAFHDVFSKEHLQAGVRLAVGDQTILFTDIVGSTRMYERLGDGAAFAAVKAHFEEIYDIVSRNNGAVIKTIGDSAMAAFADPTNALDAAQSIQRRFHERRRDTEVRLRVSMNAGACIAVNLNSGVDYFGSTVNRAAKLQECASAGEIAFPVQMLERPNVDQWFALQRITPERFAYQSTRMTQEIDVARFRPPPFGSDAYDLV